MFVRKFEGRKGFATIESQLRFAQADFTAVPYDIVKEAFGDAAYDRFFGGYVINVSVRLDMVSEGHTVVVNRNGENFQFNLDSYTAISILGYAAYYVGQR
jgi:hypothetical protein